MLSKVITALVLTLWATPVLAVSTPQSGARQITCIVSGGVEICAEHPVKKPPVLEQQAGRCFILGGTPYCIR